MPAVTASARILSIRTVRVRLLQLSRALLYLSEAPQVFPTSSNYRDVATCGTPVDTVASVETTLARACSWSRVPFWITVIIYLDVENILFSELGDLWLHWRDVGQHPGEHR